MAVSSGSVQPELITTTPVLKVQSFSSNEGLPAFSLLTTSVTDAVMYESGSRTCPRLVSATAGQRNAQHNVGTGEAQYDSGAVKGTSAAWGPVTSQMNGDMTNELEDTLTFLKEKVGQLQERCKSFERKNHALESEKQEALSVANSHRLSKKDLTEKIQKLERENDDYLRTIVSSNKKVEFFEKELRTMRVRCQQQDDELRRLMGHGSTQGET